VIELDCGGSDLRRARQQRLLKVRSRIVLLLAQLPQCIVNFCLKNVQQRKPDFALLNKFQLFSSKKKGLIRAPSLLV
jgi:hypothetical protein